MLKNNFLPLIFLLFGSLLTAQVSVSGHVTFGGADENAPIPMWEVSFSMGEGNLVAQTFTDENGFYQIDVMTTSPGQPPWFVETFDFCTGNQLIETIEIDPNTSEYVVDLVLCEGIDPPDPVDDCNAFFYSEPTVHDGEGYAIAFYDLSFHGGEITSWEWDFGDGAVSTEQNPTHVYAETGDYLVSLTINGVFANGETCSSTIEYDVVVWDEGDCDCPEDVYDPVCVYSPSGAVFEFTNPCYAECAGFEDYGSCEPDCVCPDFFAPVCITLDNGELITFPNHCYAECEGYTPDQWEDCDPNNCDCTEEYNPVCVVLDPNGPVITFTNACEAECAGFQPGDYQDCESDCICPEFYSPVCVIDPNGDIVTFDNYCFAQCEGYGPDQWIDCEAECDCPEDVYDPVCIATPGGIILTFDNACYAECAGFSPEHYYPCDGEGCVCPEYEDPVCVITADGDTLTFSNPCFAECEGYTPDQWFHCDPYGCDCPDVYDPVCVVGAVGLITFPNACLAECAGFTPEFFVECNDDCVCDEVWDPVCVAIPGTDEVIHFPNACLAECAGFSPDNFVECEEDCICPDVWDPVCVIRPDGVIITYSNLCEAECAGYDPALVVSCEDDCICPDIWAPVCVVDANGDIITFGNACEAECEGYSEGDFVECDGGCNCPDIWDPVCVSGFAGPITFPNECVAICEGFSPEMFIDCEDCVCDDYYLPVCVIDPSTGEFIEFSNPCYAACAGYDQDVIVPCYPMDDCLADFTFDVLPDSPLAVQFTDLSYAQDEITTWHWSFGDGQTSTEQNPLHTYAEGGVYDITLVVTSEGCGEFIAMHHICIGDGGGVGGPACQSFFFLEQSNPDDLLTYQFIDLSLGNVNAWVWDFGDGTTATEQNPIHTYTEAGDYVVSLTILADDCQSTVAIPISVGDNIWYGDLSCRAWFLPVVNPNASDVFFINLSSVDAIEFTWDFGDGETSNDPLALHTYAAPGTYTVTLTIVTSEGCENSFSADITIGAEGDEGFTSNPVFSLTTDTDEVNELTALQIAPNPTADDVRLSWNAKQAGEYSWQLYNVDGQLINQNSAKSAAGMTSVRIDLSDQPSGIYLLRLQTPDGIQTTRISKI